MRRSALLTTSDPNIQNVRITRLSSSPDPEVLDSNPFASRVSGFAFIFLSYFLINMYSVLNQVPQGGTSIVYVVNLPLGV